MVRRDLARIPLKKSRRRAPALPTREELRAFLDGQPGKIGRREIARAFGIEGADKITLKAMLKELAHEEDGGRRSHRVTKRKLPQTAMIEVIEIDAEEGDAIARPVDWEGEAKPPLIRVHPARRGGVDLAVGEQALVRLERTHGLDYVGRVLRRVERAPERVLGVLMQAPGGYRLRPTDKRVRSELVVDARHAGEAGPGEVVLAEVMAQRRLGLPQARVVERLGSMRSPKSASLIAIHSHDIPTEFPPAALDEARRTRPAPLAGREDLRDLPLVTIDGEDARDFDDAVFAEADDDPRNRGGFHLIVAIADVAWYVRPGHPLDREAERRGNSVYFPDRVVPMLPERLSNDLCSLRPEEDRPCLAVHIWINADGRKLRHRFCRAMIRSAARLTYEQVQTIRDGGPIPAGQAVVPSLAERVVVPLFAAYTALARARRERGTLDLDLEERKVVLGPDGRILRIEPRPRFDSHRLIEEFMILANVCAAETLEARQAPCMYRVHDEPDPAKLDALRLVLASLGFRLAKGQVMRSHQFNRILDWAAGAPYQHLVNQLVLRTQSLAVYSPDNRGHFGLALTRYAHFTSPIRRYADLLVHRALIGSFGLGDGGLSDPRAAGFAAVADHISGTERRAAAAERDALDRYVTAWLAERVGDRFSGRISGVTRFGVFVTLDGLGADGLVPMRALPNDFYHHDAERHRLQGRRFGQLFTLGQRVEVRLAEAAPVTGGLLFDLIAADPPPGAIARAKAARSKPRHPPKRRGA